MKRAMISLAALFAFFVLTNTAEAQFRRGWSSSGNYAPSYRSSYYPSNSYYYSGNSYYSPAYSSNSYYSPAYSSSSYYNQGSSYNQGSYYGGYGSYNQGYYGGYYPSSGISINAGPAQYYFRR